MNNTNDIFLTINIGSSVTSAVISKPKYDLDNSIEILGFGVQDSVGVNKGLITNIEDVSRTIKDAILQAKESVTETIGTTVVSISGNYTRGIKATGYVTIPNGLVSETDINQAMQMALSNSIILPDYDVVHVIPLFFKVDDQEVENPFNMNGSKLEASVYIVTAKRNALINIKSALRIFGIDDVRFVLDSYAASLAVLDEQQKRIGAVVINLGASTTEFVYHKGNSIIYNGFIPVGSKNITNDLSLMLNTPLRTAEKIKIEYGSLIKDYFGNGEVGPSNVGVSQINDEEYFKEFPLGHIQTIIHARVEELLVLVKNELKKNALLDNIGSGIVLTGGMSQLGGIKELTKNIFEKIPVTIATPKNIPNSFRVSFDEPHMATVVGLIMFALGMNRGYQLDSSKKLIRPIRKGQVNDKFIAPQTPHIGQAGPDMRIRTNDTILDPLPKDKKKKGLGLWKKIEEWF
ncbi:MULTISPECIES: cell division protein FtsA [Aliarcobacter]|uniref:Cell division protein FtsA n=6 Tax=Arcobacteraceae TaxID=2808963 RepID=A0AAU0P5I2_9BACT|nr:cell division protein FtsA [Aliarcobacter cryaerophilus]NCB11227.1 cell division protein FtsA [Erysipelotrichia bacterium]WNL15021.1 cell division protein FtsA [Arcobacter sp. AZ-2023]WPD03091.1 cell division protein FtsA [Arcobacter sp. DSM 115972]WPD10191.1 cell division protein FtsA [Arcobacter sp. DSM 115954]WPD12301.1 cell division protein FtsA [Arcobacter sp. DSM 115960]